MQIFDNEEFPDLFDAAVAFETTAVKKPVHKPKQRNYVSKHTKLPVQDFFVETADDKVIFKGGYMEAVIPNVFYERELTTLSGIDVNLFGIFEMRLWYKTPTINTDGKITDKPDYVLKYVLPTIYLSKPSKISYRQDSLKYAPENTENCMILSYVEGNIFMDSIHNVNDKTILKKMLKMIFESFMPKIVQYNKRSTIFLESARLQGVFFSVMASNVECIIATQARLPNDYTKQYRFSQDKINENDIKFVKITDIPHIASTFTALTFQNMDYAVIKSSVRHRRGEKQEHTDAEEIIKY